MPLTLLCNLSSVKCKKSNNFFMPLLITGTPTTRLLNVPPICIHSVQLFRDLARTTNVMMSFGPNPNIVYMSTPLIHQSLDGPPPQPSEPTPTATSNTQMNTLPDIQTQLLLQLSHSVTNLEQWFNDRINTSSPRPFITRVMRPRPFTPRVQAETIPPEAKPFKIKRYNGTECPYLHLELFQSQLDSTRYTDAQAGHAFQETLTEEAPSWFLHLPAHSVDNYEHLTQKFVNGFILLRDSNRTTAVLLAQKTSTSSNELPFLLSSPTKT
ncbi:hypothetical protein ACLB2K_022540 [Fragaria x ananassa]